ncbi:PrgI family protein [Candidatus Saccharibacteria bacterium]|nr:PrgI family protein [Candidatus Saccharibacteria bacterium]
MARYKVPQDVEADDKLLGPFSFRQFVYLLIAGGCVALAVGLFQIFPLLAIIPLPVILLMLALALPIKKDQPMETYLAALVSYYLKPRTRFWTPGQPNSTIRITAPKIVEETRTRDITGEEATHRLSFLANIVDTGGYAIKGASTNPMREDLLAEANATADMFETEKFEGLEDTIQKDEDERHEEVMKEMREAIDNAEKIDYDEKPMIQKRFEEEPSTEELKSNTDVVVQPDLAAVEKPVEKLSEEEVPKKVETTAPKPSIIELANNTDFSVATIAKEANRINRKDEGEVFISLH